MVEGIKFSELSTVLEPSAGKGDICDYIRGQDHRDRLDIDTIEIEPDLQAALKGKGYKVVFNDFLDFRTEKQYDLILANFPFSEGDQHIQKAINLQERNGGSLVCLVNAETIKNPHSNLRKAIVKKLEEHGASIEYLNGEFTNAERKTNVEVALIRVTLSEVKDTILLEKIKKENVDVGEDAEHIELVDSNPIKSLIARFKFECRIGNSIISEYFSLKPYMSENAKKTEYDHALIELKIEGASQDRSSCINSYVKGAREKYWKLLLRNESFSNRYTSNILEELNRKITELRDCDFNEFNIEELEKELNSKISSGIESTILKLFDDMSFQHSWYPEQKDNIHYFNGWKSNKAHYINKKVILPINGFSSYSWKGGELDTWRIKERMQDMVKVFNWLGGKLSETLSLVGKTVDEANKNAVYKNIDFFYFTATFYKKGTCHIQFKDLELLKKFNIFGSQRKGWLPPNYGKTKYSDMGNEEKSVIDEFEGRESYEEVMGNQNYFIVKETLLLK